MSHRLPPKLTPWLLLPLFWLLTFPASALVLVNTLLDESPSNESDGLCSLREAIESVRSSTTIDTCEFVSQPTTIRFDESLVPNDPASPFQIDLQAPLNLNTGNVFPLRIQGPLVRKPELQLAPSSPGTQTPGVSVQTNGGSIELSGLILRNRGAGAAIGNASELIPAGDTTLELVDVDIVSDGQAESEAISIRSTGSMEITLDRVLIQSMGGTAVTLNAEDGLVLLIQDSDFLDNGGSALELSFTQTGSLLGTVSNSRFSLNGAVSRRPAIFIDSSSDGAVVGVAFEGNLMSDNSNGALLIRHFGDSLGLLNLRRNLIIDNRSDRAAVTSQGVSFKAVNNTFIDNVSFDQGPGALLVRDDSGGTEVTGNTFFGNSASREVIDRKNGPGSKGVVGAPLPQALRLQLADTPDNGRFVGNLIVQRDPSSEPTCVFGSIDGQIVSDPTDAMHNASNAVECLVGQQDLEVVDLPTRVTLGLSGVPRRPIAVYPAVDSGVVDQWPDAECSVGIDPLVLDMLGDRRDESSIPFDGDPGLPADCDIGAVELPKSPLPEEIFKDGYE